MSEIHLRELAPTPEALVLDGQIQFGNYDQALPKVNFLDAHKPLGIHLPKRLNWLRLKEWQAFQAGDMDHFFMMAIYNAKTLALVQFIYFDIKNGTKLKYEKKVPLWKLKVPSGLWNTVARYRSRNFKIRSHADMLNHKVKVQVKIRNFKKMPDVDATFTGFHLPDLSQPNVVVIPFGKNRGMYSHKCLIPMRGEVRIGDQNMEFQPETSHVIIDDHKGFYPYRMQYDWVTGFGYPDGIRTAFNLTDNQSIDPENYNENCLWMGNKCHILPAIKVERPEGERKHWLIRDKDGAVDLRFDPVVQTDVNVNLLLLRSRYRGPYGFFNGKIHLQDDQIVEIKDFFGMGEKFYLRA